MTQTLVHLPYSGWSRRVRQALAVEGIEHRRQVYVPTLGEPVLRWRARRFRGAITVPVLLRGGEPAIMDSTEIAGWASTRGRANLLPEGLRGPIEEVVDLAERVLMAGRVRATLRTLDDPEALRETLPPALAKIGPIGPRVAAPVARGLVTKYGGAVPADVDSELEEALEALARRVGSTRRLFEDRLTWADLAAASALVLVSPPEDLDIGPRTRAAFTHEGLASRFSDLGAWRDDVDAEASVFRGGR